MEQIDMTKYLPCTARLVGGTLYILDGEGRVQRRLDPLQTAIEWFQIIGNAAGSFYGCERMRKPACCGKRAPGRMRLLPILMNRGRQGETQICSVIYVPQETGEQMSAVFSAHGFKTIIRLEHNIPKRWLQRDM